MFKRFLEWIRLKEKLHDIPSDSIPLFKEGQIWWCGVGDNVGREINGKGRTFSRPVLIFKRFNRELFFGFSLTSKLKVGTWFVQIFFQSKEQTVVLTQGKTFDARRLYNMMGESSELDFTKVKDGFHRLYFNTSPCDREVVGIPQKQSYFSKFIFLVKLIFNKKEI